MKPRPRLQSVVALVSSWLALSAACAFLSWTIYLTPADAWRLDLLLGHYADRVGTGLLIGAVVTAVSWALRNRVPGLTHRLAAAASLFYFSGLKVLGWPVAPWIALAGAAVVGSGLLLRRPFPDPAPDSDRPAAILLLHGMGTMAGLYAAIHINGYLAAWPSFLRIAASLLRLAGWLIAR